MCVILLFGLFAGCDALVGPDGETGQAGPRGETGPQGEIGPQGARGESGPDVAGHCQGMLRIITLFSLNEMPA